tara:strand:+ start:133 stop:795 length:663 start_codon:yes stop_codon:yes gene_type:complete
MLSALASSVMAGNFNVGAVYSGSLYYLEGEEQLKQSGNLSKGDTTETMQIPSLFLEYNTGEMANSGDGWVWGVDIVPFETKLVEENVAKNDQRSEFDNTTSKNVNSITQNIQADLRFHTTLYVETPGKLGGFYGKAGISTVQINTNESLGTGAEYPNEQVFGVTAGIGFKRYIGNLFTKIEGTGSMYETINLTSRTSDAATKIEINPSALQVRFAIGVAF